MGYMDDQSPRDRSRIVWDNRGIRIHDTQGMKIYEVEMGPPGQEDRETEVERATRLYRERRQCLDCGTQVPAGSIYCKVDAPYGLWHWLAYFSAIRWRR